MVTKNVPLLRLFILVASSVSIHGAAAKTAVKFAFRLTEPDYRTEYTEAEIETLEARLSSQIADLLNKRVGFLAFSPTAQADYDLTIELGRKDPNATGSYIEVGFNVKLAGPDVRHHGGYWVQYCPEELYEDTRLKPKELEDDVALKLKGLSDAPYARLVEGFLTQVPICDGGAKLLSPPLDLGWVLPYRRRDLLMDWESRVSVENKLPSSFGQLVSWRFRGVAKLEFPFADDAYHARMVCLATSDETDLDKLSQVPPDQVQVGKVYVVQYWRFDADLEGPAPPPNGGPSQ